MNFTYNVGIISINLNLLPISTFHTRMALIYKVISTIFRYEFFIMSSAMGGIKDTEGVGWNGHGWGAGRSQFGTFDVAIV